jgi:hypothetical protein
MYGASRLRYMYILLQTDLEGQGGDLGARTTTKRKREKKSNTGRDAEYWIQYSILVSVLVNL